MNKKRRNLILIFTIAIFAISLFAFSGCKLFAREKNAEVLKAQDVNRALSDYQTSDTPEDFDYDHVILLHKLGATETNDDVTIKYIKDLTTETINLETLTTLVDGTTSVDVGNTRYIFNGWYMNATYINKIEDITSTSFNSNYKKSSDPDVYVYAINLYAKWKEYTTYTINYNLTYGGATGTNNPGNPATFVSNEIITLQDPTPPSATSSVYYEFDGWYTNSSCTDGNEITEVYAALYEDTTTLTIYAKWISTRFDTITLVLDGNNEDNSDVNIYSDTYTLLTDANNNKYIRRTNAMGTLDLTKIYFGDPSDNTVPDKETKVFNSNPAMPLESYSFAGWYTTRYYVNQVTSISIYEGDETVYAKWNKTVEGYSIEYELNGGHKINSNPDNPQWRSASASARIYPVVKDDAGYMSYTFEGWYTGYDPGDEETDPSYTGFIANSNTAEYVDISTGTNLTLYAKWSYTTNAFSVTYELNGGVNHPSNLTSHTSDFTLLAPTRTEETIAGILYRFAFDGWYTTSNFTGDPFSVAKAADVTVYAKWLQYRVYGVEYHWNGGVAQEGKTYPNSYSIADGNIVLPDPSRLSSDSRITYIFLGWYIGSDAADEIYNSIYLVGKLDDAIEDPRHPNALAANYDFDKTNGQDGDIDLYAAWQVKPDTFTVDYDLSTKLSGEEVINSKKNPTYTSSLNNARELYAPLRIKYTYSMSGDTITNIHIKAYAFQGWYDNQSFTGDPYDTLYYTMGALTLYPKWGVATEYDFAPGTAIRVNEFMQKNNSGEYILYGVYPQTKIEGPSGGTNGSDLTYSGVKYRKYNDSYYRYEPVMWHYVGQGLDDRGDSKYLYVATTVLEGGAYSGDTNFISITSVSQTIYRPLKEDLDQTTTADAIKAASDYAEAKGITIDEKMGTAQYWLQDMKDVSASGAAIDEQTANNMGGQTFRNYVGARGNISYTLSTKTTLGSVPVLLLDSIVTNS